MYLNSSRLQSFQNPKLDSLVQNFDQFMHPDTSALVQMPVNPYTADSQTWVQLGLYPNQARSLVKYLQKGGKLNAKDDLWKLYFMDSVLYKKLVSRIQYQSDSVLVKPKSEAKQMYELNSADSATLVQIRGIGPTYASRIIKYRKLLGGYAHLTQLNEVYGISAVSYEQIKEFLYVDASKIKKLNVNNLPFTVLAKHPYIGQSNARIINKLHQKSGQLTPSYLQDNLNDTVWQKIYPYLSY
jgi:hypothetical protein